MEREMKLFVTGPRPLEKREEVSQIPHSVQLNMISHYWQGKLFPWKNSGVPELPRRLNVVAKPARWSSFSGKGAGI